MYVIEASAFGGPEVLQLVTRDAPDPGPDQILVRVSAAGVNPVDWLTRSGALAALVPDLTPPFVVGWDFAGVVEQSTHPDWAAGRRVLGFVPWFDTLTGAYAELIAVDPGWLAELPEEVSDTDAATYPLNAMTAEQALDLTGVAPGHTVLVTGASGGVGGFAVQRAVAAGARVIAVASAADEDFVAGLGAEIVLGRADTAALVAQVRALVPDGVDAALDGVPMGPDLIGAVRDGGSFVTVLDQAIPAAERGIRVGKVSVVPDRAQLTELVKAAAAGELRTRVAAVLPLAEAAETHRRGEAGGNRGRLVIDLT